MTRPSPECALRAIVHPDEALSALGDRVQAVGVESIPWSRAAGRILAEPILLDRPSPACDVSAMDGYALRMSDLGNGRLPVSGEVQAGVRASPGGVGTAVRVFTGAMIPPGSEAVIPREQLEEQGEHIVLPPELDVVAGQHIRRRAENGRAGNVVAEPGQVITSPILAAVAACGRSTVLVHERVRVGILVTGGEVLTVEHQPEPWQLRDSNGPALLGLLNGPAWLQPVGLRHAGDDLEVIARAIRERLEDCDALLLTGGVSAGDHDYVPAALRDLGMEIVFHQLAIRPGKPVLGATDSAGRVILALPGNPVSVLVTARRLAFPVLARQAGVSRLPPPGEFVEITDQVTAPARLTWFPLVRCVAPGRAALLAHRGSGDWVAAAASDGFIEVPAGASAAGSRRMYRWAFLD